MTYQNNLRRSRRFSWCRNKMLQFNYNIMLISWLLRIFCSRLLRQSGYRTTQMLLNVKVGFCFDHLILLNFVILLVTLVTLSNVLTWNSAQVMFWYFLMLPFAFCLFQNLSWSCSPDPTTNSETTNPEFSENLKANHNYKQSKKTCKTFSNCLKKSWKFRFLVCALDLWSNEQDKYLFTWNRLHLFKTDRNKKIQIQNLTRTRMLLWRLGLRLGYPWGRYIFGFGRFGRVVFAINLFCFEIAIELWSGVIRNGGQGPRGGHIKIAIAYVPGGGVGGCRVFGVIGCSQRSVAG